MHKLPPDDQTYAVLLAAMAGAIDTVAFLLAGGFFASFMSGNSTRMAIGISANWYDALFAAELVLCFVAGVAAMATLRRWRPVRATALGLTALAVMVAMVALLARPGLQPPVLLLAFAMGGANLLLARERQETLALTYMTGTLVRIGQGVADWLGGQGAARQLVPHLLLWLGFLGGGMMGVGLYARTGAAALWAPAALAAVLAGLEWWQLTSPERRVSAGPEPDPDLPE